MISDKGMRLVCLRCEDKMCILHILMYTPFLSDDLDRHEGDRALAAFALDRGMNIKTPDVDVAEQPDATALIRGSRSSVGAALTDFSSEEARRMLTETAAENQRLARQLVEKERELKFYQALAQTTNVVANHQAAALQTEITAKTDRTHLGMIAAMGSSQTLEKTTQENSRLAALLHRAEMRAQTAETTAAYERDAREAAEQNSRTKSGFLANMSHELRTPLNAIIGFSEMVASGIMPERAQEYATHVYDSGQHLLSLVNGVLDLSKIEAGEEELHETEVPLNIMVGQALSMTHQAAGAKHLALANGLKDIGETVVRVDQQKMLQVLVNLVNNAIKYTDAGRIMIRGDLTPQHLVLSVQDTGRGIPAEKIPEVFGRFRQVDAADATQGHGLGLAITRALVELHGGDISLESTVDQGTIFRVQLPRARVVAAV